MASLSQPYRLSTRGLIDRSRPLPFSFDGISMEGFEGDTLASALLANGVRVVARSFKYHRPRGIYAGGLEEPNALVTIGVGNRSTPNTRATQVWLEPDLVARSQNRWPSLRWDLSAVSGSIAPVLSAGFYYKTFMRPRLLWPLYERGIRQMAGMGRAPRSPDPDHYDKQYHRCDCLVIGLGPAGLAAALAASQVPGRRVIALEADRIAGGSLLFNRACVDGREGVSWATRAAAELALRPNVRMLLRTVAFGYYDDNLIAAVEHLPGAEEGSLCQRIHWIRAVEVILATGAHERPLVFPANDRPGIILANAARNYLNRYAVAPGRRVAIVTNNESAYALAHDLTEAGVAVVATIDMRVSRGRAGSAPHFCGYRVTRTWGRSALRGIRVESINGTAPSQDIACDALCVSGGWSPALQLHAQAQGATRYEQALGAFVPGEARQRHVSIGAAAGSLSTDAALQQGWNAGGGTSGGPRSAENEPAHAGPFPAPELVTLRGKAFVDLQNDVTVADLRLAAREGFDSVEHLKRYTTLGMGTDQGKTSNINGLGLLAQIVDRPVASLGVTTFRPPYVPVTLGALAGHHRGTCFAPTRQSPLHNAHRNCGAVFVNAGLWHRPRAYPRPGESLQDAISREVRTVRSTVGIVDISTLGKIELQGRDCAEFLERVYCNRWRSLEVGKARYGLMLREDGIVLDDGTTSRLGADHYFMTTSTANAAKVMTHLECCLQVFWPDLDVHVISVTEQWCAMAVAGAESRHVLARVLGIEMNDDELPHLGIRTVRFGGAHVRLLRVSFSGERAYELYVPNQLGPAVWERILAAGKPFGITPYGTDALTVLRVEKGHVAGPEIDGRTTPADLGLARLRSEQKHYIGRRLGERPALRDPHRKSLVGLIPVDTSRRLRSGAQLATHADPTRSLGHVTSAVHSATLGHSIALGLLLGDFARTGASLRALDPLHDESIEVKVVDPVFVDPKGERLHV